MRGILFEDLVTDPAGLMRGLFEFVGADPIYAPRCDYTPLNQSAPGMLDQTDNDILAWLVQHFHPHNELLSQFIGRNLDHWNAPFNSSRFR